MRIVKYIITNPWVQTVFFLALCFTGTYWVVANFFDLFKNFIDIRKKEFWAMLGIVIPVMFLVPTFMNMMLFAKIVQIAENTKKTHKLLQTQIEIIKNQTKQ